MKLVSEQYVARRRFSEAIRRRRRELDMTQKMVAGMLGVSVALVSAWERRGTLMPVRFVRPVEKLLGYDPGILLGLWAEANQERIGGYAE